MSDIGNAGYPVMRTASFFTGIAGFEEGFRHHGIETVSMCEIDKHCQTILARHFPNTPLMGDIADVRGTDILAGLDAFVAGFPCKDTSIAAPGRLGLAGTRSGNFIQFARLLHEYLRCVDEHHPRFVVLENPDGLLASPGIGCAINCGQKRGACKRSGHDQLDRTGWDMAAVTRGLEDLGYGWAYRVVDGRHFRLPDGRRSPQRRKRLIVVGHRGGDPRPAWLVLGDRGASEQARASHQVSARGTVGPVPTLPAGVDAVWRKSARPRAALSAGGYETWVSDGAANTLTDFDGGNAARQTHLIAQHGRIRTLTFTEWERLNGFPDNWTAGVPDSARFLMLGNTMHVGMASWLGARLADVHTNLPLIGAA